MWIHYFRFRTLKHLTNKHKVALVKIWYIQINSKQTSETITHNLTTTTHQENSYNQQTPSQVTEGRERKQKGKWQSAWDYTHEITAWDYYTANRCHQMENFPKAELSRKNLLTVCWTSYKPGRPSKQPGQFASSSIPLKAAVDLLWMKYELF